MVDGIPNGLGHQTLRADFRHRLDADGTLLPEGLYAQLAHQEVAQPIGFLAPRLEFDAGVHVLDVLPENHHIELLRLPDRRRNAGEPADRADTGVEVEDLSQRDVEGAHPAPDWGSEGALDGHPVLADDGDGVVGEPGTGGFEGLLAGEHLAPDDALLSAGGLGHGGVEDPLRRAPDVGPGAIPLDEGDDRVMGDHPAAVSEVDFGARRGRCQPKPRVQKLCGGKSWETLQFSGGPWGCASRSSLTATRRSLKIPSCSLPAFADSPSPPPWPCWSPLRRCRGSWPRARRNRPSRRIMGTMAGRRPITWRRPIVATLAFRCAVRCSVFRRWAPSCPGMPAHSWGARRWWSSPVPPVLSSFVFLSP